MKKLCCLLLGSFAMVYAHAQLAGTRWKTVLPIDTPTEVLLQFGKDTAVALVAADNSLLEKMTYQFKDGLLTLKKIEGMSDCDTNTDCRYRIKSEGKKMTLLLQNDPCYNRSNVLDQSQWTSLQP